MKKSSHTDLRDWQRSYYLNSRLLVKLYIKNMVTGRCKSVVKEVLTRLGLHYSTVELGEAEVLESISVWQHDQLKSDLLNSGFELMDDKKNILIQRIKSLIIELVHFSDEPMALNLSGYLSQKLDYHYTYLANVFSEGQGMTIEKFFIAHKIERVKELLAYNELTLTEIAYTMHYSSVSHLSKQFKKVTGLTPSEFKQLKEKRRSMLEDV